MLMWQSEMFSLGFKLHYIDDLVYWDYLELVHGMSESNKAKQGKNKGYFASGGELTDTHRKMIENRKKLHGK